MSGREIVTPAKFRATVQKLRGVHNVHPNGISRPMHTVRTRGLREEHTLTDNLKQLDKILEYLDSPQARTKAAEAGR